MSNSVSSNYFSSKCIPELDYPLYALSLGKTYVDGHISNQSGNKGPNCVIYATNMLRDRMGKKCPQEYLQARKIEVAISEYRKERTKTDNYFKAIKEQLGTYLKMPKENVKAHVPELEWLKEIIVKGQGTAYTTIERFFEQDEFDTIEEFLQEKKIVNNQIIELCKKLNINHLIAFESLIQQVFINYWFNDNFSFAESNEKIAQFIKIFLSAEKEKEFAPYFSLFLRILNIRSIEINKKKLDCLSFDEKWNIFDDLSKNCNFFQCVIDLFSSERIYIQLSKLRSNIVFQAYNLKGVDWNPLSENSLGELIQILRQLGPLETCGHIGTYLYDQEPKVSKIYQKERAAVYEWPKTAKMTRKAETHAVIVVGARDDHDGDGTIFYLDPNDKSEKNRDRRILTMPYSQFKSALNHNLHYNFILGEKDVSKNFPLIDYYLYCRGSEDYLAFCERAPFCKETQVEQTPKLDLKELLFSPSSKEITIPIDIGFGNELGIRMKPFWDLTIPFEWSTEGWKGLILQNKEFKFVKVHASGEVEWEQGSNRVLQANSEIHMPLFSN